MAQRRERNSVVISQRHSEVESPGLGGPYSVGTKAFIKKMARPEDGRVQVIVLGTERVRFESLKQYRAVSGSAIYALSFADG